MYTGSCLCGGVTFEIDGELEPIQICHCIQCRKAQGSAIVTNIPVQEVNFRLISGADLIGAFESSPGKQRCFCKNCGSPVYSKTVKVPGVVRIRAGTLDGDLNTKPAVHFYMAHKANWFEVNDALPHYREGYVVEA
ncbi:GFA family protein [Ketobacter alkanivorans]|uniref:Aldehyde-activating protein n=1 Tax=Ketobacter alkanivorans TaxID=1917421 RepID=A0A2K9LNE9_9GAMM|nr:GFA family protein [Ketobacter alkanivorans]AUM13005.1 aldehyde-activating protein [Ketobacter alkanivorans]